MRHDFVRTHSIVRAIWGDPDVVLLIFAGAAAEFALNRAVDWLFVTGRLPRDPIGRLFSTVRYAQQIIFADDDFVQRALIPQRYWNDVTTLPLKLRSFIDFAAPRLRRALP